MTFKFKAITGIGTSNGIHLLYTNIPVSIEQENANNLYKDRLRTWEVQARIALNETKINN